MNQFRDILMLALIALGFGVAFTNPTDWTWAAVGGPTVVNALDFMAQTRPWSVITLFALALALFMTRLRY
jgi:hypothetical protein